MLGQHLECFRKCDESFYLHFSGFSSFYHCPQTWYPSPSSENQKSVTFFRKSSRTKIDLAPSSDRVSTSATLENKLEQWCYKVEKKRGCFRSVFGEQNPGFFARRAIVFARYSLRTRKWCVNRVCVCLCPSVCWCRQIAKKLGFWLVYHAYLRCRIQEGGSGCQKTKSRNVHNSGFEQIASESKNNPRLGFYLNLWWDLREFWSKIVSDRPVSLPIWTQ